MADSEPDLDGRHRNEGGEIARKHGNTLVSTLRESYGPGFAPGVGGDVKLIDVLHRLDEPSMSQLANDKR